MGFYLGKISLKQQVWETFAEGALLPTLSSGYQKQQAADFRTQHPDWSAAKVKEESRKLGNKAAHSHLKRLDAVLRKPKGA